MNRVSLPLNEIQVEDRSRTDLGDIDGLARSIKTYGLIQPIVVNQDKRLIAGGRRLAACRLLGLDRADVVYRDTLSEDELKELELEENVRRKDMDWKERACSVADIHRLKARNSALAGEPWGFEQTGEMLGRARSHIWYCLTAADAIRAKDPEVLKCTGLAEFIKLLMERREREALQKLAQQTAPVITRPTETNEVAGVKFESVSTESIVNVSSFILFGDSLTLLRSMPRESVDHILTDPPYGIDMANLEQENTGMDISTVLEEHAVDSNLKLLRDFIPLSFDILRPNGFCVLWCDTVHFSDLMRLAQYSGYAAQRWPLVWCKPQAMNQAASYNFTKATEIALVLRKPGATLLTPQASNWWQGTFEPGEKETYHHPFAKPRALWKWIASAFVLRGQTVLDPFAGGGSCPLAMIEDGNKPIAIECSQTHYPVLLENVKAKYTSMLTNVRFT